MPSKKAIPLEEPISSEPSSPKPKRSFTITHVVTSKGHAKGSDNLGGVFKGKTPSSIAKKAASRICKKSDIRGQCTFTITIKETTRFSKKKEYTYRVKRVRRPTTVQHAGKDVVHKYTLLVKAVKPKKVSSPSPKKKE